MLRLAERVESYVLSIHWKQFTVHPALSCGVGDDFELVMEEKEGISERLASPLGASSGAISSALVLF